MEHVFSPTPVTDQNQDAWVVVINLVALVLFGVLGSFWLIRYTNWFPVVGGILGLTGAFAWVAFLSNIIKDNRKERAQDWIDRNILRRWQTIVVLFMIILVFVVGFTSWHGTIVIDSAGDVTARTGEVRAPKTARSSGFQPVARINTTGAEAIAILLETGFWSSERYIVKLNGLPSIETTIWPWRRTILRVPNNFYPAPVILLRPTAIMSGEASGGGITVEVQVNGKSYESLEDYRGESVWIGASDDVSIPESVVDRWRLEILAENRKNRGDREIPLEVVNRWTTPRSVIGNKNLEPGAKVAVRFVSKANGQRLVQGQAEAIIRPATNITNFPQQLVIDVQN